MSLADTISLYGILATLAIAAYQLRKQYQWNRSKLSYELTKEWTAGTLPYRRVIEAEFGSYLTNVVPAAVEDPAAFVSAGKDQKYDELKTAVIALLNFFEDVSVLYLRGMLDTEIIDQCLKNSMIRYYDKLAPLKKHIEDQAKFKAWPPLDHLMERWKREQSDSPLTSINFPGSR